MLDASSKPYEENIEITKEAVEFAHKYEATVKAELGRLAGTAHGLYKAKPEIDFERLKEVKEKVDIPLVLHGASGVPDEDVKKAISYGICKVNISTELKELKG